MRIGTRKSAMAMAQTEEVIRQLQSHWPDLSVEVADQETRGDDDQRSKLAVHGGKGGAFVSGIHEGILSGNLQMGMHSLKDMPGNEETPGLVIAAYMKRDDTEDALLLRSDLQLDEFKASKGKGFKVGTNAVRRAALIRRLFPKVEVIHFRGAADTRIDKLENRIPQPLPEPPGGSVGPADALILAKSGLYRVGLEKHIAHVFSRVEMLPAAGQGIVAVECAETDWETRRILAAINDKASEAAALAEREVLWILDGHCNSPIAVHGELSSGAMSLTGQVMSLDGQRLIESKTTGPANLPKDLGRTVAMDLIRQGAHELIEESRVD
ncbi:MAG: hydroxymethylbilane synthase [Alphaproteobacteria bacterium]|nr:hydroxymethylbilane synthase [Alphaproteobacteria bacterium]